ncbi:MULTISPECIES: helix-turn-helix transcriptional regulator [Peribacillus]|uniref:Helix-turn-helix domain-containing protein n=1 Tax=Peribacillus frigoritolerans TaxID=450367 RepID=A0AAJ1VEZ1_9BACI|nr:helix-turn-helix domain-containing protein [Peribacillus frigoritolerans]MCM3167740.1 helix-turn-helix domain-containing protein [Peribacillus frigoritolerans]MDM5285358.1 helix-turn-helix domain-containing protein [Peribacillus frigoritolerans]MEB2629833.1 helix-turn-helix domain-containing protein [Peribacillus frigoritolerans]QYF85098.1 helix-turn-helix domain-containing protein [Brevibacterium sp. PAMC21349]
MEQTLKITNVLADPTRYYIYQHIVNNHGDVSVQEIADSFNIHPNVARLHLSKLEDIDMLTSNSRKTGKGGRPSRLYRLSDKVIQLHFPYRNYQLLAKIAVQSMMTLGEQGKQALYETGKVFGEELINQQLALNSTSVDRLAFAEKVNMLKNAATIAGLSPEIQASEEENKISFRIFNCPFKEVTEVEPGTICSMHNSFLKGMFEALFENVNIVEIENMMSNCAACSYQASVLT